jgi:hypothetical protein
MNQIILIRDYKEEATIGRIIKDGKEICKTLERPNLDNAKDDPNTKINESSCIPEGVYSCKKYSSVKYPNTWEVKGVKNRSKILFHSANTINQLLGCIAPCTTIIDQDPKGSQGLIENKWYASQSRDAFKKFSEAMDDEFEIKITSDDSLCEFNASTL